MELLAALQATVTFMDDDARATLSGALYDAGSQEWDWMQEHRNDGEAYAYHRERWGALRDAAAYVAALVKERA